jgi:hypothetical protein
MGSMHMHQIIPIIEGWGSQNHIQIIVKNIEVVSRKFEKIS